MRGIKPSPALRRRKHLPTTNEIVLDQIMKEIKERKVDPFGRETSTDSGELRNDIVDAERCNVLRN